MRKCDEHQTLVHLDVHVCPVFVCVCVGGGGGTLIYIYIHENPKKILKLKDFEPPKWSEPTMCENIQRLPSGVCDGTGKIEVRIGGGLVF